MAPTELTLAVCLFPLVGPTDFQGPLEQFGFLTQKTVDRGIFNVKVNTFIKPTYLGITRDPIEPMSGPRLLPDKTYGDVKEGEQFDIVFVPGGYGTARHESPQVVLDFVRKQAPGAKYVLSVCAGADILAGADVLNGKRATTNKSMFLRTVEDFKDKNIEWVRKARWVVDGNVWTSSGMAAGSDMAYAFVKHLAGYEVAEFIRGLVEFSAHEQDDDEFAEFHGLI
ncbi:class I glutamine amidotransferase-like protein [Irpex rosettiformis]|uniref:Class I glutamine amidotransferase-like protein n=1 Tax=Irpex rosettiformis TaxID=378272 RepID=A0ACB8UFA6_9APHY|nr:class I glutamine amidotransferase-like protein [Irpex rosettiformis]